MSAVLWPHRTVPFLNRVGVRREMRRSLVARRAERRVCLIFVHGPEGLGRFSVVSEFFHEDREAFGGVYIEVTARRPDGSLVPQGEMLGQALRGLGVPDADQPDSDTARADAFQRLSAGRRFLLVVKDAAGAEQVANLIPAAAPDAAVVVTTRAVVRELFSLEFIDIALQKLPQDESRQLLAHGVGTGVDKIDAGTLRELADLCDGFPLLLRILAAQLNGRPRAAARFLTELRGSMTALLVMDHSQRMTKFLDLTYTSLLRELQGAYRWLSLLPGPGFGLDAAAVALDTTVDVAERLLDDLVDANLLIFEDPGRYSFHSIVRADARRRNDEEDDADLRSAATARIVSWYLTEAIPRDGALSDRWRVGPAFAEFEASGRVTPSLSEANTWLDAEWPALVACVGAAQSVKLHETAWQVCVAAFKYLHKHGHYDAWLDSHRLGLASAEIAGNVLGVMLVSSQRGAAYLAIGDCVNARRDFVSSRDAAIRAGHALGEQSAYEWLGKVAAAENDIDTALDWYDQSESVITRAGDAISDLQKARMRGLLRLQRARALLKRDAWHDAAVAVAGALQYFDERSREVENRAKCLLVLGKAENGIGHAAEAARWFEGAADLFAHDNLARAEADARFSLGEVLAAIDRQTEAVEAYRRSLELFVRLGDSSADTVCARLDALAP